MPHLLLSSCSRAHKPKLWSPSAATSEAQVPRACAPQQERPLPVHPNEEYPPLAVTGESLRESSKDPAQPKINKILEKHQAGPLEPV